MPPPPANAKAAYATMVYVRATIVEDAGWVLARATTIAVCHLFPPHLHVNHKHSRHLGRLHAYAIAAHLQLVESQLQQHVKHSVSNMHSHNYTPFFGFQYCDAALT